MADAATVEERRIMVAVDESEESIYALQWSLHNLIAKNTRYKLVLLCVRPQLPAYSLYGSVSTRWPLFFAGYLFSDVELASAERYREDVAGSVLERAENICKSYENIKIEAKSSGGDARDVICDMVEKLGVDILVMGSHGYGFIKRALLGSVSDYCARNAKCPVLIVKRPAK